MEIKINEPIPIEKKSYRGLSKKVRPKVLAYFEERRLRVFSFTDLKRVLSFQKENKIVGKSVSIKQYQLFLRDELGFKKILLEFPGRTYKRYLFKEASLLQVALTLIPNSYLTHYSAVFLHGLTDQIPKTIYLNFEQRHWQQFDRELEQSRITRAFQAKQRESNNIATCDNQMICILNGKFTDQQGVIDFESAEKEILRTTNIERTLIDIAVRPAYAGGVFEVLNAYRLAKEKVSINKLAATLKKMDYIYPYHQAIGFYLERAGVYNGAQMALLRHGFEMNFDFYLVHGMKEMEYSKEWRLFYPKGF